MTMTKRDLRNEVHEALRQAKMDAFCGIAKILCKLDVHDIGIRPSAWVNVADFGDPDHMEIETTYTLKGNKYEPHF